MMQFSQGFAPISLDWVHDLAAQRKAEGWRYVQTLAVNTEKGVDLIYSFMKDGVLDNKVVRDVPRDATVPSITDLFLEAFVFENEIHDLFGVHIENIAIDFGGNFYQVAVKEPMTIISPEVQAAREKARKVAKKRGERETKAALATAANAEFLSEHPETGEQPKKRGRILEPSNDDFEAKLAGMDPEKVARARRDGGEGQEGRREGSCRAEAERGRARGEARRHGSRESRARARRDGGEGRQAGAADGGQ